MRANRRGRDEVDADNFESTSPYKEAVEEIMDMLGKVPAMAPCDGRDKAMQPEEIASLEAILRRCFPVQDEAPRQAQAEDEIGILEAQLRISQRELERAGKTIAELREAESPRQPSADWKCAARSSNMGANDPQECDWPVCGCDPYADKVIEALQESGVLTEVSQHPVPAPEQTDDYWCPTCGRSFLQGGCTDKWHDKLGQVEHPGPAKGGGE